MKPSISSIYISVIGNSAWHPEGLVIRINNWLWYSSERTLVISITMPAFDTTDNFIWMGIRYLEIDISRQYCKPSRHLSDFGLPAFRRELILIAALLSLILAKAPFYHWTVLYSVDYRCVGTWHALRMNCVLKTCFSRGGNVRNCLLAKNSVVLYWLSGHWYILLDSAPLYQWQSSCSWCLFVEEATIKGCICFKLKILIVTEDYMISTL